MNERERIIRLWFDMWIKKADLGIDNIFTDLSTGIDNCLWFFCWRKCKFE